MMLRCAWSPARSVRIDTHIIAPETVEGELQHAGFVIEKRDDAFVDRPRSAEWLIAARRP
jgi:hypothetical protein